MIDIVDALELLGSCIRERGESYQPPYRRLPAVSPTEPEDKGSAARDSIVTLALGKAGAPPNALSAVAHLLIVDAYTAGRPPLDLSLGAVVVLHAAESAELRGQTWAMSLQAALDAASRFVELIPDHVVDRAARCDSTPAAALGVVPRGAKQS
jgi:hypothetical protein